MLFEQTISPSCQLYMYELTAAAALQFLHSSEFISSSWLLPLSLRWYKHVCINNNIITQEFPLWEVITVRKWLQWNLWIRDTLGIV